MHLFFLIKERNDYITKSNTSKGGETLKREWLIAYREAKGLSQLDVANAIGVGQGCYSNYENGSRTPSPNIAKKIARIFKFDWTKFYEEES